MAKDHQLLLSFASTDGMCAASLEAGCDEAGRGCLAGPVFAAAVILPSDFKAPGLTDSKKLSARSRNAFRKQIEREAIAWCVERLDVDRIEQINILNASHEAMSNAVKGLCVTPDLLLIDGNMFRTDLTIPFHTIVGGDSKYLSIAAASVLAKTHRDEYMALLDGEFPQYGWAKNKGYGTAVQRAAIREHGLTEHHRPSFCRKL